MQGRHFSLALLRRLRQPHTPHLTLALQPSLHTSHARPVVCSSRHHGRTRTRRAQLLQRVVGVRSEQRLRRRRRSAAGCLRRRVHCRFERCAARGRSCWSVARAHKRSARHAQQPSPPAASAACQPTLRFLLAPSSVSRAALRRASCGLIKRPVTHSLALLVSHLFLSLSRSRSSVLHESQCSQADEGESRRSSQQSLQSQEVESGVWIVASPRSEAGTIAAASTSARHAAHHRKRRNRAAAGADG